MYRFGRNDNFLAKAQKLSILPTSLDIFDIRQHYVRILYIEWSLHAEKFTDSKEFQSMSACANCAARHCSILFADALCPIIREQGLKRIIRN